MLCWGSWLVNAMAVGVLQVVGYTFRAFQQEKDVAGLRAAQSAGFTDPAGILRGTPSQLGHYSAIQLSDGLHNGLLQVRKARWRLGIE